MDKKLKKLEKIVKKILSTKNGAHGWDHIQRVRNLAQEIAKKEGGNNILLDAMALLHDISRNDTFDGKTCLTNTIKLSQQLLSQCEFKKEEIAFILDGIASHSLHAGKLIKPNFLEAQILFDADKIDATGEIGLARLFSVAAKDNVSIDKSALLYLQAIKKFEKEFQGKLYTKTSTQIIIPRILFSKEFLERLINNESEKLVNLENNKSSTPILKSEAYAKNI